MIGIHELSATIDRHRDESDALMEARFARYGFDPEAIALFARGFAAEIGESPRRKLDIATGIVMGIDLARGSIEHDQLKAVSR